MNVQLFLADYIAVSDGKINALGIGWTFTGPGPVQFAVGGLVSVPWNQTNERHSFSLVLTDSDGQPVHGPEGEPIRFDGDFEAGRPPGHTVGSPIMMPLPSISVSLVLPPSSRFEWVASIDGQTHEDWRVGFNTRPPTGPTRMAS